MESTPKPSPSLTPSLLDTLLNGFQMWAIENPKHPISVAILPIISFVEGLIANNTVYLDEKRQKLGFTFCCAGQVVLGDFQTLETALTSPQARTWRLGTSLLSASHGPGVDQGRRNTFLISLSDTAVGGEHDPFRQCLEDYFFNDGMIARREDQVAKQLIQQLGVDYRELRDQNRLEEFFAHEKKGFMGFLVKYLHYVLFQINPEDETTIATLTNFHYTQRGTLHYFTGSGILERFNLIGFGKIPDLVEQVATIYQQSPTLANFQENNPRYNNMTQREMAKLMVAIMSIAGLQGPLHFGRTAMGYQPFPAFKGRHTHEIQVKSYWDRLDLDDRESIKLFLLECSRLFMPVSASHRVATEPFTVTLAGKERTFPTGTKILIPMVLGMLSESFWGLTAYEFNAQRDNLCPYHMGFHSVGERHAGRICPAKELALEMLTDIISVVGKVRRSP